MAYVKNLAYTAPATTASVILTLGAGVNSTAGNTVIVRTHSTGGAIPSGITDSRGNTYRQDAPGSGTGSTASIWSAYLSTALLAGDTITVTFTSSKAGTTATADEFSGVIQTSPLDKTADSGNITGTTATAGPTAATAQANELIVTAAGASANGTWTYPGGAWTAFAQPGTTIPMQGAWQIVTSTGTFSAAWTDGSAANIEAVIATYKMTGGAGLALGPASLPSGTEGAAYSQSLTATGGTSPYTYSAATTWTAVAGEYPSWADLKTALATWAVVPPGLPPGLSLNTATGAVTGTPTREGPYAFTGKATDAVSATATVAYTLTVASNLAVTTASLPGGTASASYSQTLTASGGWGAYTWSLQTGTLPAGLHLNATTGVISGIPTGSGTSSFTVQVTDGLGFTATAALSITVGGAGSGTALAPYLAAEQAFASGTATTKPGTLAHATAAGDAIFVVCSTGSAAVTPTGVTDGAGNTYTQVGQAVPANGMCSYVYAAFNAAAVTTAVNLPSVAWNATGNNKNVKIIGCPGVATAAATDTTAGPVSASGTGSNPSVTSTTLAQASELALTVVTCGNAGLSIGFPAGWAEQGSDLHTGSGLWTSAATQAESSTSAVTAAAALGASAVYSILLVTFKAAGSAAGISVTSTSPPAGTVGTAYTYPLTATGGTPPYTWSLLSGTLPAGLHLNPGQVASAGAISYVGANPGADGQAGFTEADYAAASATIGPLKLCKIFYSAALPATWAGSLEDQITAAFPGTVPVLCWNTQMTASAMSAYCGSIPPGQVVGFCWQSEQENSGMTAAAFISGWQDQVTKIRAAGNPNLLAVVASYAPGYAAGGVNLDGAFLPGPAYTDVYAIDIYQHEKGGGGSWPTQGLANYDRFQNWMALVLPFNRPLGITEYGVDNCLESTNPGMRNTRIQADAAYLQAAFTPGGAGALSPYPLWCANYWWHNMSTTDCTKFWKFTDAAAIATWQQVAAGSGATSGSGGSIYGTPTTNGTSSFTVRVTDSGGVTASQALSITVGASTPAVTTTSLPGGATGVAYDQTVFAAGGLAPYTFTISAGSLPPGLSMSSSGQITGTPTTGGSYSFTARVTDTNAATATRALSITIAASLTVTVSSLPGAAVGSAYSQALAASGGTSPYTWTMGLGSLPPGLALDPGGVITGTPTAAGTYSFTLDVTDAAHVTASASFAITVSGETGRPVSAAFLATITGSHQMVARATVCSTFQTGTAPTGTVIPIIDGDVQLDGTAQVRATLDLTTSGDGWDPRYGNSALQPYGTEIYAERGAVAGGSAEWVGLGYFKIYTAEQDGPGQPVRISGQDRMASIAEGRLATPVTFKASATVADVFTQLVGGIYPRAAISFDWDAASDTLGTAMATSDDRYGFLAGLATSRGKIMYFDYRGILVVKDPPDVATPVWTVAGGQNGVLVSAARTLDRDGVYNAVIATTEGATTGAPSYALAYDANPASPTYWDGPYGKVPAFYTSPQITTLKQAIAAASSILKRTIGLPFTLDFTAVPNPAMQPYDPVAVTYGPYAAAETHVLMTLTIPLTAAAPLEGTTREQGGIIVNTEGLG